jgi:2-isopropylmalate synthase
MAVDADTVSASLKAVVSGLNRCGQATRIATTEQAQQA